MVQILVLDGPDPGSGRVVQSYQCCLLSPVTAAIVQRGTLKRGCILVAGKCWAKVRFLFDENGQVVKEAGPSSAVEVIGWKELPSAGETILEVESEVRSRNPGPRPETQCRPDPRPKT